MKKLTEDQKQEFHEKLKQARVERTDRTLDIAKKADRNPGCFITGLICCILFCLLAIGLRLPLEVVGLITNTLSLPPSLMVLIMLSVLLLEIGSFLTFYLYMVLRLMKGRSRIAGIIVLAIAILFVLLGGIE